MSTEHQDMIVAVKLQEDQEKQAFHINSSLDQGQGKLEVGKGT